MGERSPDSRVEIGLRKDGVHVIRLHRTGGVVDIQLGSQNPEPFKETGPEAQIPQSHLPGQEMISKSHLRPVQGREEIIPQS